MCAETRPIGGVGDPEWTDQALPPLGRAGTLCVGVIDTGIVLDRKGRPPAWFRRHHLSYCADEDADAFQAAHRGRYPSDGHGTFVAGLVLREAPTARVRMWGVLAKSRVPNSPDEGSDRDDFAVMGALAALAINPSVQVVNLSFGDTVRPKPKAKGRSEPDARQTAFQEAVATFVDRRPDVAVVASAGNGASTDPVYPAALDDVLSVGAVDETGFEGIEPQLAPTDRPILAGFSNSGDWVDAYARGVDVLGPLPQAAGPQWARWKGTSFAAAVVSGRIAQVAIERGLTGKEAQAAVLAESVGFEGGKWVLSVDSVAQPTPD